jgi:ASC-1-like (ASCH) protein
MKKCSNLLGGKERKREDERMKHISLQDYIHQTEQKLKVKYINVRKFKNVSAILLLPI